MGLGAGSIPLAAALNWVLKDGIGQVGGIVFARWVRRPRLSSPAVLARRGNEWGPVIVQSPITCTRYRKGESGIPSYVDSQ